MYFKELPAGQEVSLEYKFRIAPQVPTRDFFVAVHLVYEEVTGQGFYSNTVFNGTIEVVEKAKLIDTEGIFMYLMIAATFGIIGEPPHSTAWPDAGGGVGGAAGIRRQHCTLGEWDG